MIMILEHRIFFSHAKLAKRGDSVKPRAAFTISINNLITTGKKFRSIIHKVNKTFSSCDFMLCDTLNRHNIMMDKAELTQLQASKITYDQGDIWLNENQKYLDELTIDNKLIRWDNWINNPGYNAKLEQIGIEFELNLSYKEAFYNTAAVYLSRRNLSGDAHLRRCIQYLQEECAVMLLWADNGYNFELYPAKRNQAMAKTFEIFIRNQFNNEILLPVKIDIKYKRKKEQEIANSALQSILQITTGHIYVKDEEGYYLFCNDNQAQSLGLTIENIIGKTDYDLSTIDKANQYREADLLVMTNGSAHIVEENAFYNNKYSTFLSTKAPLYGKNAEIIGVVGISFDITDRKEKEKLILENQAYKAKEKLQQKFKTIVDRVAHDIRSPLFSLQGITDLSPEISKANRTLIRQSIERISDIAANLLRYFKPYYSDNTSGIQQKSGQITLAATDLLEIISEKRYEYLGQNIEFITKFNNYFVFIHVDSQAFRRAVSNLINNAVDALEHRAGEVIISLNNIDDKVQIIIEDNGKGMSRAIQQKILNNMGVTSGKPNGHGIGFCQVHDMLAKNGGILNIQSKLGIGTKVILTFFKTTAAEWIAEEIKVSENDLIIILDDDPAIHEVWEARLQNIAPNIKRKHFKSGIDVINHINNLNDTQRNHVVLMTDYELLGQDLHGLDVVNKTKVCRSILVTSHYGNNTVRQLARQTNTKILPKPLAQEIPIHVF